MRSLRFALVASLLTICPLASHALTTSSTPPASGPYAEIQAVGRVYSVGPVEPVYPGSPYVELSFTLRVLQPGGLSSAYLTLRCFGNDAYTCSRLVPGTVLGVTAEEVTDVDRQVVALSGGGL